MRAIEKRAGVGVRLTEQEMKARDWRKLYSEIHSILGDMVLPGEPRFNEFDWDLRWYVELGGCLRLDGSPITGNDGKWRRSVWRRLAEGPIRAGAFTIVRDGRWGIAFILDPAYATERKVRRRRRLIGGLAHAFEVDFRRRSQARLNNREVR